MKFHPKRWPFLVHRWLGIALSWLFVCWFVSGMVMMYVGHPKLTEAERLAHLPPLQGQAVLSPQQALDAAGVHQPLAALRLAAASGAQAVYFATPDTDGRMAGRRPQSAPPILIDAHTGQRLDSQPFDARHALASAAAWAAEGAAAESTPKPQAPPAAVSYLGLVEEDAHTHSAALDMHRPLHHVQLHDAAGTQLYVSSRTGEVVRDATRSERGWNYLGSWLHWLYMFRGGAWDAWWALIIDTLAALGCVAVLTGAAVGIWRWRFGQPYRTGRRTPFPQPMMRWHHVSGMLFALAACAWVFSGLMSMNPLGVFSSQAEPLQVKALQGGPLLPAGEWAAPQALLAAASSADSGAAPIRELRWQPALGRTLALAFDSQRPGAPRVLDARDAAPLDLPASEVQQAAARLLPAPVAQAQMLTAYDFYYYPRADHTMTGGHANRPLPVLRLVFDDEHASWVYVDPRTAQVLERTDRARRASRWLFTLLHSWDWLPLLERRPLWDAFMLALSLGGAVLSLTGVVIGARRLALKARQARALNGKARRAGS